MTLGQTLDLVMTELAGKTDKAGAPLWHHCVRVATRLPLDATDDDRHAALLHDVIEDGTGVLDLTGYSLEVVQTVIAVTRLESETYGAYIDRVAKSGRSAIIVKLSDLRDNLDPSRGAAISPSMWTRYQKAAGRLHTALLVAGEAA